MPFRLLRYSLLVACLLASCSGRLSMRQLEQLEARVNDVPDSVLAVLTAADAPRWGERCALHALLTVQAQDKSYIDVADDSLISVATQYYQRRGLPLHRLQAFYYHGRVHANAGRRHEAMTAYTRATDFVPKVDAPYAVGLLYAQMGILYGNDYNYSQGITYLEDALRYYELADKERLQNFAKLDMGLFNFNMKNISQAEPLFNEVLAWGEEHNDTYIIYSVLDLLLRLYDATGNIADLDSLLHKYPIETILPNSTIYSIVAHHYARMHNKVAYEKALIQAWEVASTAQDTAIILHKIYHINKVSGHIDSALNNLEQLFALQDSTMRVTLKQPLIAVQRDYYQSQLEVEKLRNLNYRYLMGIVSLVLLIVATLLFVYVRNRFHHKQEELDGYIELAEELRHTLYRREESISSNEVAMDCIRKELQLSHAQLEELRVQLQSNDDAMQAQIAELLGGQFQILNKLSETYYELEGTTPTTIKNSIFAQVKNEIESLCEGGKKLAELEAIVNRHLDNVMNRLRAEIPYLKEKDYTFLTFFYARFSGKAISLFTRTKRDYVYKIKERLCNKIKVSDAPSKEFFLSKLS